MASAESGERKISRRNFLKGTATVLLTGAAVAAGWSILGPLVQSRASKHRKEDEMAQSVKPAAAASGSATLPGFTVFWLTDTQYLSEANPDLYIQATDWIVKNWKTLNGKMVIHSGDMVNFGDQLQQWVGADNAMKRLTDNGIPYLWCAGNHDDLVQDDPSYGWAGSQFDSFNPGKVSAQINAQGSARWAGDYHDGMNTAVSFSAGGMNLLVIAIEWNAPPDALDWVAGLLEDKQYEDYYVMIAPHAYEDAYGSTDDQRWGPTLSAFRARLRNLLDTHGDRVFLTLNGHFATDSGYHTPTFIGGRNQLMFDRQESTDDPSDPVDASVKSSLKVGGATITLLEFDCTRNAVCVKTYDPYKDSYRTGSQDDYIFTMLPNKNPIGVTPNYQTQPQLVRAG